MKSITPDVLVCNEGTVFVFCPLTSRARQWIDENVLTEPWQWFGNALVVEQRYAWGLGQGMKDAGLRLAYGNTPVVEAPQQTERTAFDRAIDAAWAAQADVAIQHGRKPHTRAETEQFILTVMMMASALDESKKQTDD